MGCLPFVLAGVTCLILSYVAPESPETNAIVGLSVLLVSGIIVYVVHRRRANERHIPSPRRPADRQPAVTRNEVARDASTKHQASKIRFSDMSTVDYPGASVGDIAGLKDAFTGEPLSVALGLCQCLNCKVYYHQSSVDFLKQENNGKCAACSSTDIVQSTNAIARRYGRNYEADAVTLSNYRKHAGRVVTFVGTVRRLDTSRDGRHYALMFEDKSWRDGFKMVVFASSVRSMGGRAFLHSLVGKTIRVRGLLRRHRVFGFEIIGTTQSMILETGGTPGRRN